MQCCQCEGIERHFNHERAYKKLADYRERGPEKTTRMLIDALVAQGVEGARLLDVGGGVGAIQHALFDAGAESAVAVDAAPDYLDVAREQALRAGYRDRVDYYQGDFVDLAPSIAPADVVTLDRVLCCYHDVQALVQLSAARAKRLYGVVYPPDDWWIQVGIAAKNLVYRLQGSHFRLYVHPTETVEALLHDEGFERRYYDRTMLWQVAVYHRA